MQKTIAESITNDIIQELGSRMKDKRDQIPTTDFKSKYPNLANINEQVQEPGFDSQNPPALPGVPATQVGATDEGSTSTTDIAQQTKTMLFVKNSISQSLPFMIGYVQPLQGASGFVFANKQKSDTQVPGQPGDQIITRKLIETDIREVVLDFTNETIEDINRLFGDNFIDYFEQFQLSGGEVWDGPNGPMAKFFLELGMQRMSSKINQDFVQWLDLVSTKKGQVTINNYSEMMNIFGVIGELRESLYKNTHKSGKCWILVSPKISAFLSSTIGSTMNNSADMYNKGERDPNNKENGYVLTMGDIEVYQHDFYNSVTGGTQADSESTGKIYMGFTGGPGVSSVIYSPYKEYIVQGGDDYYSGQSSVFYRVRDSWCTNPLDTYDETSVQTPVIEQGTDPRKANKSQFIVSVDLTFMEKLIV